MAWKRKEDNAFSTDECPKAFILVTLYVLIARFMTHTCPCFKFLTTCFAPNSKTSTRFNYGRKNILLKINISINSDSV